MCQLTPDDPWAFLGFFMLSLVNSVEQGLLWSTDEFSHDIIGEGEWTICGEKQVLLAIQYR